MKKEYIGAILVMVFIIGSIVFFSATSKSAEQIIMEASEKSQGIGDYKLKMNINSKIRTSFMDYDLSGNTTIFAKDNKSKSILFLSGGMVDQHQEVYNLPEKGTITCKKGQTTLSDNEWTCTKGSSSQFAMNTGSPKDSLKKIKEAFKEGAIKGTVLGSSNIAGRSCSKVKLDIDPVKLLDIVGDNQSSLSTLQEDAIKKFNFTYSMCLGDSTGIPLLLSMNITGELSGSMMGNIEMDVFMEMKAESLETGINVPESEFELPAEVQENVYSFPDTNRSEGIEETSYNDKGITGATVMSPLFG